MNFSSIDINAINQSSVKTIDDRFYRSSISNIVSIDKGSFACKKKKKEGKKKKKNPPDGPAGNKKSG